MTIQNGVSMLGHLSSDSNGGATITLPEMTAAQASTLQEAMRNTREVHPRDSFFISESAVDYAQVRNPVEESSSFQRFTTSNSSSPSYTMGRMEVTPATEETPIEAEKNNALLVKLMDVELARCNAIEDKDERESQLGNLVDADPDVLKRIQESMKAFLGITPKRPSAMLSNRDQELLRRLKAALGDRMIDQILHSRDLWVGETRHVSSREYESMRHASRRVEGPERVVLQVQLNIS